jgi:hypothetical protein
LDESKAACRKAIDLNPNYAAAHCSLGVSLRLSGEFTDAYSSQGTAFTDKGDLKKAVAACRRAILCKPDFPDAHKNLALALLGGGEFSQGWEEFEWRFKCKDFPHGGHILPPVRWDGRPLAEEPLLIHAEQGLGDTLQFIRYLPLVAARCKNVILLCQKKVERIVRGIAGSAEVVTRWTPRPDVNLHCPLMSLPFVFGTTLENIPLDIPYLQADPTALDFWRQRLAGDAANMKVGLTWAGNHKHHNDRNRSMSLSTLLPLAGVENVQFYSLQKGDGAAHDKITAADLHLVDHTAELNDFADTAALVANLDLVISVDTSTAHLAGAMGKPVWVLLPFAADWRWMTNRQNSPWYPTMRLFRQQRFGDWEPVVAQLVSELSNTLLKRPESVAMKHFATISCNIVLFQTLASGGPRKLPDR